MNSLSNLHFGAGAPNMNMKNEALNFGVVAPPDQLPNYSLYNTVYSKSPNDAKDTVKSGGSHTLEAGKISAGLSIGAMILAALSFLPFIRRH